MTPFENGFYHTLKVAGLWKGADDGLLPKTAATRAQKIMNRLTEVAKDGITDSGRQRWGLADSTTSFMGDLMGRAGATPPGAPDALRRQLRQSLQPRPVMPGRFAEEAAWRKDIGDSAPKALEERLTLLAKNPERAGRVAGPKPGMLPG